MLKKSISVLLVILLMIPSTLVFAQQPKEAKGITVEIEYKEPIKLDKVEVNSKVTQEEAIKIFLDIFSMDKRPDNIYTNHRNDYHDYSGKKMVWEISYHRSDKDYSYNTTLEIDSDTGVIKRLHNHKNRFTFSQDNRYTKVSYTEAKNKADSYIEKLAKDKINSVILQKQEYNYSYTAYAPFTYSFNYIRLVDGVEFPGNFIRIDIDGEDGEIRNYECNWSDENLIPKKDNIIDLKVVKEQIKNNVDLILKKVFVWDESKREEKSFWVYEPNFFKVNTIDAQTGRLIDWDGKDIEIAKLSLMEEERGKLREFTPYKPIVLQNKVISQDEAKKIAKSLFTISEEESFFNAGIVDNWNGNKGRFWTLRWDAQKDKYDKRFNLSVVLEAYSGDLMYADYSYYIQYPEDLKNSYDMYSEGYIVKEELGREYSFITQEQSYRKAMEFLLNNSPYILTLFNTDMTYIEHYEKYPSYYFGFDRIVDGIKYDFSRLNISLNESGEVVNFNCVVDNFASKDIPKDRISREEAFSLLSNNLEISLRYILPYNYEYSKEEQRIRLVYSLDHNRRFSYVGINGDLLDYQGNKLREAKAENIDDVIKNHPAKKEIQILHTHNVIDFATFEPNKKITLGEFLKMAVSMDGNVNVYSDYYYKFLEWKNPYSKYIAKAYEIGLLSGDVESIDVEKELTREELAMYTINLMGYKNIAEQEDIFIVPYQDRVEISKGYRGYIALYRVLGLGGEEVQFNPKDKITMGEAAKVLYKSIPKTIRINRYY